MNDPRDFIKSLIDIIDDTKQEFEAEKAKERASKPSRFRQIYDILVQKDQEPKQYSNTPDEVVAGVDSVTLDAGGGINGPKHPADIRVKDPRGY